MSANQSTAHAGLRARIGKLRGAYGDVKKQHLTKRLLTGQNRGGRLHWTLRDELRPIQVQLKLLVPLYRALVALKQQPAGGKAEQVYRKRFHTISRLLADLAAGSQQSVKVFAEANADVLLLVPVDDVSPSLWVAKTVSQLLADATEKHLATQRQCQANAKRLFDARDLFLASLTAEQVVLMKDMLHAEKLQGNRAVIFKVEDLPK